MGASLNLADIPREQRRELGLPGQRERTTFSKEECRTQALKCLAVIAGLTRAERRRVLRHALKVNEV